MYTVEQRNELLQVFGDLRSAKGPCSARLKTMPRKIAVRVNPCTVHRFFSDGGGFQDIRVTLSENDEEYGQCILPLEIFEGTDRSFPLSTLLDQSREYSEDVIFAFHYTGMSAVIFREITYAKPGNEVTPSSSRYEWVTTYKLPDAVFIFTELRNNSPQLDPDPAATTSRWPSVHTRPETVFIDSEVPDKSPQPDPDSTATTSRSHVPKRLSLPFHHLSDWLKFPASHLSESTGFTFPFGTVSTSTTSRDTPLDATGSEKQFGEDEWGGID